MSKSEWRSLKKEHTSIRAQTETTAKNNVNKKVQSHEIMSLEPDF